MQLFRGFLGRFQANLWLAAGAQPARCALANGHTLPRLAGHQRLLVRVDGNKIDAGDILRNHAVDGIVPTAPHANHANQCISFCFWHSLYFCSFLVHCLYPSLPVISIR